MKAAARAAGRPPPHAMLYMNAVYDWPFDKTHGKGAEEIDVLDIHGVPHAEQCDPGLSLSRSLSLSLCLSLSL